MWELDHKEGWAWKSWCLRNVVLEKTLESPLDCKEIKPVNPKGNQPWIFIGRTEAEAPILWPLDVKSQLIGEDLDAGKNWRQEKKGVTEDEMIGWHHRLNGRVCANSGRQWRTGKPGVLQSMGCKESDLTGQLNNNVFSRAGCLMSLPSLLLRRFTGVIPSFVFCKAVNTA